MTRTTLGLAGSTTTDAADPPRGPRGVGGPGGKIWEEALGAREARARGAAHRTVRREACMRLWGREE
jgi:hypothetical protein